MSESPNPSCDSNYNCVCPAGYDLWQGWWCLPVCEGTDHRNPYTWECQKTCSPPCDDITQICDLNNTCVCAAGYELFNGVCVSICGSGSYRDPQTGDCRCPEGSEFHDLCEPGLYHLIDLTQQPYCRLICLPTCPDGNYALRDPRTGSCLPALENQGTCWPPCDSVTQTCDATNTCVCDAARGYIHYNGICQRICGDGGTADPQTGECTCEWPKEAFRNECRCICPIGSVRNQDTGDCDCVETRNPDTGLCECKNGYDSTFIGGCRLEGFPPQGCTTYWTGVAPVRGGPWTNMGMWSYSPIPTEARGCTGNYTFSFQVYPQAVTTEVQLLHGSQAYPPNATIPHGASGYTHLYLDFDIPYTDENAPSRMSFTASPTTNNYPDTIIHWQISYGTDKYSILRRFDFGPPERTIQQINNTQGQYWQISPLGFWDKKLGSVKLSSVVIGVVTGSCLLLAVLIGGFVWKRRIRRRAIRRVSAERGAGAPTDKVADTPAQPKTENAAHISKGSLTRRHSARRGAAPTAHAPTIPEQNDPTSTAPSMQTMQELIQESEKRQAAATRQLLAEQAAMYEEMIQSILEGGTSSAGGPSNLRTNRDADRHEKQSIYPSVPSMDEIEVLGRAP